MSALGHKQTYAVQNAMSVREPGAAQCVELRGGRSAPMPVFNFLVIAGLALIALLFIADATLESGSPVIATSQRSGLPASRRPDAIQTLTATPAPAPDMTSQAVLAAQPSLAKVNPAARAARAEAFPKKERSTQPFNSQHNYFADRFSAKGQ